MKVYELLSDASKWIKNDYYSEDEHGNLIGWCLIGAAEACYIYDSRLNITITTKITEAIRALYPERVTKNRYAIVAEFNDHPDTTFEDVLRVLKFADV